MFAILSKFSLIELLKFAGVGTLNTTISLTIIYSLKWYALWGDVTANVLGYLIGILFGFVLNGRWTFKMPTLNSRHLQRYALATSLAYLLNLSAVLFSINICNISGDYAQLVGVVVFTLTSFLLIKLFVFSGKSSTIDVAAQQY